MSASAGIDLGLGIEATDPSTYVPAILQIGGIVVGRRGGAEQFIMAVAVTAAVITTSLLTAGATAFLVIVTAPFIFIGIARMFSSWFNRQYSRLPVV